jgi:hypothetical protein
MLRYKKSRDSELQSPNQSEIPAFVRDSEVHDPDYGYEDMVDYSSRPIL